MTFDEHGETEPPDLSAAVEGERWQLLRHLDAMTRVPLAVLGLVWLVLIVIEFTVGLGPRLQLVTYLIWGLFVADFVVELVIAPRRLHYLRTHLLSLVALALPALRVVRALRALAFLRAARVTRSVSLLRLLTSLNRGMGALGETLGRRGLGFVFALTAAVTFVGAAGMLLFEGPQSQGALANYGDALWWTAMVMTTMGSDYFPRTPEGRVLGWLLAVYAFAIFGYITASIASFFVRADRALDGELRTRTPPKG